MVLCVKALFLDVICCYPPVYTGTQKTYLAPNLLQRLKVASTYQDQHGKNYYTFDRFNVDGLTLWFNADNFRICVDSTMIARLTMAHGVREINWLN